jgi:hypothetical protein
LDFFAITRFSVSNLLAIIGTLEMQSHRLGNCMVSHFKPHKASMACQTLTATPTLDDSLWLGYDIGQRDANWHRRAAQVAENWRRDRVGFWPFATRTV